MEKLIRLYPINAALDSKPSRLIYNNMEKKPETQDSPKKVPSYSDELTSLKGKEGPALAAQVENLTRAYDAQADKTDVNSVGNGRAALGDILNQLQIPPKDQEKYLTNFDRRFRVTKKVPGEIGATREGSITETQNPYAENLQKLNNIQKAEKLTALQTTYKQEEATKFNAAMAPLDTEATNLTSQKGAIDTAVTNGEASIPGLENEIGLKGEALVTLAKAVGINVKNPDSYIMTNDKAIEGVLRKDYLAKHGDDAYSSEEDIAKGVAVAKGKLDAMGAAYKDAVRAKSTAEAQLKTDKNEQSRLTGEIERNKGAKETVQKDYDATLATIDKGTYSIPGIDDSNTTVTLVEKAQKEADIEMTQKEIDQINAQAEAASQGVAEDARLAVYDKIMAKKTILETQRVKLNALISKREAELKGNTAKAKDDFSKTCKTLELSDPERMELATLMDGGPMNFSQLYVKTRDSIKAAAHRKFDSDPYADAASIDAKADTAYIKKAGPKLNDYENALNLETTDGSLQYNRDYIAKLDPKIQELTGALSTLSGAA